MLNWSFSEVCFWSNLIFAICRSIWISRLFWYSFLWKFKVVDFLDYAKFSSAHVFLFFFAHIWGLVWFLHTAKVFAKTLAIRPCKKWPSSLCSLAEALRRKGPMPVCECNLAAVCRLVSKFCTRGLASSGICESLLSLLLYSVLLPSASCFRIFFCSFPEEQKFKTFFLNLSSYFVPTSILLKTTFLIWQLCKERYNFKYTIASNLLDRCCAVQCLSFLLRRCSNTVIVKAKGGVRARLPSYIFVRLSNQGVVVLHNHTWDWVKFSETGLSYSKQCHL